MKTFIPFLFCFLAIQNLFSQEEPRDYKKYISRAESFFGEKNYKKSAENYSQAFRTMGWKGKSTDRYNAARSWALANNADSAIYCLERIVSRMGFDELEKVEEEEDFISLHSDARWKPLLEQIKRNELPTGWLRWGNKWTSYEMQVDFGQGQEGRNALTIKSVEERIDGFGTIMQNFLPEKYLGKRIRLTGYLKTENVKGYAGFWMRVDKEDSKKPLSFDNMSERGIKGTTDWNQYEVVLNVPEGASNIAFGAILKGTGQLWFDKLNIEEVPLSVPVTGKVRAEPNLDFEK